MVQGIPRIVTIEAQHVVRLSKREVKRNLHHYGVYGCSEDKVWVIINGTVKNNIRRYTVVTGKEERKAIEAIETQEEYEQEIDNLSDTSEDVTEALRSNREKFKWDNRIDDVSITYETGSCGSHLTLQQMKPLWIDSKVVEETRGVNTLVYRGLFHRTPDGAKVAEGNRRTYINLVKRNRACDVSPAHVITGAEGRPPTENVYTTYELIGNWAYPRPTWYNFFMTE